MMTNKMKKEISLEERRLIQLEMLKEIHSFCVDNNIRYSLAYGTLIGAIRHKGFIPWDDDMDIMMPLPDMLRLKNELKSKKLIYLDIDVDSNFEYPFARIAFSPTYRKNGFYKDYGVNIDVYPVCQIPDSNEEQSYYFHELGKLYTKREKCLIAHRISRRVFSQGFLPYKFYLRKVRDFNWFKCSYGSTNTFHVVAGPISTRHKRIFNYDIFETTERMKFEGIIANVISSYDNFLRTCYGDYMQLPPEEERHPYHGGHYYWK